MKTTIKLALLASALLLALAGCKNTFTPTDPSPDSFAKNVEGGNAANALYVIDAVANGKYDTGEYRVTVKFSQPVDLETVTKAVTFYNLKDGLLSTAKSEKNGVVTGVSKEDALVSDNTKEVHFKLPKEAKDKKLWVEVVGKDLKAARSGQKMDQDRDGVQGESDDDFYAAAVNIGSPASSYGRIDNLDSGAANKTISAMFSGGTRFSFRKGLKEDLTADTSRPNIVTHIFFSNNNSTDSDFESLEKYGIDNEAFKNLLQKHIVVEQYVNNKWESIQTTFKESSNASYPRYLVGGISVGQDVSLRVRLVDIQDMKNIKSKKFEYKLKYTHDAHLSNSMVLLNENSGLTNGYEPLAASTLKLLLPTSQLGSQTLRFELPTTVTLYGKEGAKTVTPKQNSDNYYLGYKGFDTNTLKRECFITEITGAPIYIQYKKNFTSSGGITKYLTLDFDLKDACLKEGSTVGMTSRSVVEYVGDFTNTDTDHYFAGAVTQFCFTYDNVFDTKKISDKMNQAFNALVQLYKDVHGYALDLDRYKYNDVTKALFKYLKDEMHIPENNALQFIDEGIKNTIDLKKDAFHQYVVYTSLPLTLYISPEVQIAAFQGVISGSLEDVQVGPLNFKQFVSAPDDPLLSAGWQAVTFN